MGYFIQPFVNSFSKNCMTSSKTGSNQNQKNVFGCSQNWLMINISQCSIKNEHHQGIFKGKNPIEASAVIVVRSGFIAFMCLVSVLMLVIWQVQWRTAHICSHYYINTFKRTDNICHVPKIPLWLSFDRWWKKSSKFFEIGNKSVLITSL